MATPGFPSTNVNSFIKINGAQSQANKEILTAADGNFCTEKNKRTVCHWLKVNSGSLGRHKLTVPISIKQQSLDSTVCNRWTLWAQIQMALQ